MTRKPFVTAVVALSLLGVAACGSSPAPGEAAYVGDQRITVDQVQADASEVIEAATGVSEAPLDPAEVNRRQVNRLVTQALIEQEADRRDITVSDAEVDRLIGQAVGEGDRDEFAAQLAAGQLVPPSGLVDFARSVALNEKLLAVVAPDVVDPNARTLELVRVLGELSAELGTGVSPRFGTWDAAALTVGLPPNDLSTPAAEPQVESGTVILD